MTETIPELDANVPVPVYDRTDSERRELAAALEHEAVPVTVYGLGKMGLPLAAVFANRVGPVVGVDIDAQVVESVNEGISHVAREPGLDELVAQTVADDRLHATDTPAVGVEHGRVHVIIVPTPITDEHEPDLSALEAVVDAIGTGLDPGDFVVIECTVPPRTTADLVHPRLVARSGLDDAAFGLAFCPERTSSGRALADIRGAYPKVVGGINDHSTAVAQTLYESINDKGVIPVADATTAEAVKVFEGLYRDVNIALANELATLADAFEIDVRDAIDVANTQPFCDIHDPGPGVGGHCIPFYPYFVIDAVNTPTPLLETARAVNDAMPEHTVELLADALDRTNTSLEDAHVLLLGVTYRPGVEEIRAAPALDIAAELAARGARVSAVDPMLETVFDEDLELLSLEESYERSFDGTVLVTPHEEFEDVSWDRLETPVVIDGRDTLEDATLPQQVHTLGAGGDRDV